MSASNRLKTEDLSNKETVKSYMLPLLKGSEERAKKLRQDKKDWVAKHDFKRFVGKATLNKRYVVPNYVNLTPSESPLDYKFRQDNKNNWVAKSNFIA